MNEPMDRKELIEQIEKSISLWVDWDRASLVTLDSPTVQRSLKEALGFLSALRALEKEPHGV